jgi:hypothetical protein
LGNEFLSWGFLATGDEVFLPSITPEMVMKNLEVLEFLKTEDFKLL